MPIDRAWRGLPLMATGLATRCPACSTVFRVVPDQLRISEGWVRCGRCAEVFNAAEGLIDVETGAPRRLAEDTVAPEVSPAPGPTPRAAPPAPAAADTADVEIAFEPAPPAPAAAEIPREAADIEPSAWSPREDSEPPVEAAPQSEAADSGPDAADSLDTEAPADTTGEIRADPAGMPSFLRRAERAQRWRRPGVRAALLVLLLLGLAGLLGQVAYSYRDLVAARFASTRPLLEQSCALLGCTIGAPHLIDSLVVESSGLVRVERSNVYKLSVVLRNRTGIEAALPALDLALTDSQGKLLARRVLRAADLGVSQANLGAGRELALQATLQAATAPVAGYTIEIFYP
jgi:predicted Zn finger-like uncharacterized protein